MAREKPGSDYTVSRTYRVAMKLGEDYMTLEETITLPSDASDAEIQAAVDLGWRIYHAQNDAVEQQIESSREAWRARHRATRRRPEVPASRRQQNYLAILQKSLNWSDAELARYASEQNIPLEGMSRMHAATLIERLMRIAEKQVLHHTEQGNDATTDDEDEC
jgi:hypothetical protein